MLVQRLISYARQFIAFTVLLASSATVLAQTGAIQHVHDPCIFKAKDAYYIFSTGMGIPIRKSSDLSKWEMAGKVFEKVPAWTFKAVPGFKGHLWAPDISFFDGQYHLYYSVSTFGSRRSCIGLATNKTLDRKSKDYKWEDQGMVIESSKEVDWNAIDPNIVLDEKGTPWLSFGSFWSGLKIVRINHRTGKPAERTIYAIAARPGEGAIEAPFIVQKGNYFYLFASWDHCCKGTESDYKIVVGRSRRVNGPYLDRKGKPMIEGGGTLVLSGYERYRGPGHNAVLMDGKHDWLIHHFYDAERKGIPTLQVRLLLWADDGWPLASEPDTQPAQSKDGEDQRKIAGEWEHSVDFGPATRITFSADGKIDKGPSSWALTGSTLTLRWPRQGAPSGVWIDRCILSPDGKWYVGRNQEGVIVLGKRVTEE
jgi:arabinan endo-1,5-alpha-L-arabinosidase